MMHLLSYPRWVRGSTELGRVPLGHFGWTERKASGIRRPSFCAQSCTCVTLARYLDLSVLPFFTQQMGPVCPTLPNTKSSGKSRPKARGVVGWAQRNGGGPLQEVSVEWKAHPASTLGKDSTEGTMEQLAWLPQASGLSGSAVSLIGKIVPALPGKSPISQPPPKS